MNFPVTKATRQLEETLKCVGFTIFRDIVDLGYMSILNRRRRSLNSVTAEELLKLLHPYGKALEGTDYIDDEKQQLMGPSDTVQQVEVLRERLPLHFRNDLKRRIVPISNPGCFFGVAVHVALHHRQGRFRSNGPSNHQSAGQEGDSVATLPIDFCLGGSTLNFFATRKIPKGSIYVGARLPSTNTIVLSQHKAYAMNLNDPGYQFERWVTGNQVDNRKYNGDRSHLQWIRMDGRHGVLFSADCDGILEGSPCEIKCSKDRVMQKKGLKTILQMISSGSIHLVHGLRNREEDDGSIVELSINTLEELGKRKFSSPEQVVPIEERIIDGLDQLRQCWDELDDSDTSMKSVMYTEGRWRLECLEKRVAPREDVLRQLMLPPQSSKDFRQNEDSAEGYSFTSTATLRDKTAMK